MLAWLNPLNWIKILSLLKFFWSTGVTVFNWVAAFIRKRDQQKQIDQIHQVEKDIDQANQVEDDAQRLKEKADAACKMEQALDPSRRCD